MRTTSKQFNELADLTLALVNDCLGAGEGTRLERMIADSTAARRTYIELMCQFAGLEWEKASVRAPCAAAIPAIPATPISSSIVGVMCHWPRQTADYLLAHTTLLSLLIATAVIGSLMTTLSLLPAPTYQQSKHNCAYNSTDDDNSISNLGRQPRDSDSDNDGKLKLVARITGLHNCRWSPDGRAPYGYDHLSLGRELKLDAGLLEITYYNGAKLVLEGPVEFTVEKPNACRLDLGKLTAKVSQQAVGFTVETPTATIVDLGTEFGVEVEQGGTADVHVFVGQVEVGTAGTVKRRLGAGEAVRFTASGAKATKIALNEGCFAHRRQSMAGIVQTAGAVQFLDAAPPSVVPGSLEDDRLIFVFAERKDVVLQSDLTVTVAEPGVDGPLRDQFATLPAGTHLSSYLLHYDPATHGGKVIGCCGSVAFGRPVLGVIAGGDQLAATDGILGAPETNYAFDEAKNRGMEITDPAYRYGGQYHHYADIITIGRDRRTIMVRCFHGALTTDQFRVLVAGGDSEPDAEKR